MSTVQAGGQQEDRLPRVDPKQALQSADALIKDQQYNEAVPDLVDAVQADSEQLPAAEQRFNTIRAAREAYVIKGQEVSAELRNLLAADIPPDQVVPTAFQALQLIEQMNAILPNPNEEDKQLIAELQSRVLLTIDQRRFAALMDAAAAEIAKGNYERAVEIYVNGLGDYGFEVGSTDGAQNGTSTGAQLATLLETDGISIQIGSFQATEYGLSGEAFQQARERVRSESVGDSARTPTFQSIAEPAQTQATEMIDSFASGNFDDAKTQIATYLPLLGQITGVYRTILDASEVISAQETINAERAVQDETYKYNYHIRFVNDIVNGRQVATGSQERKPEGVLYAVKAVWDVVANGPVDATREYGSQQYAAAIARMQQFPWQSVASPASDAEVSRYDSDLRSLYETVAVSYQTTLDILNVSQSLGLTLDNEVNSSTMVGPQSLLRQVDAIADAHTRDLSLESIAREASVTDLARVISTEYSAYDVAAPLASQTSTTLLSSQRRQIEAQLDRLTTEQTNWHRLDNVLSGMTLAASGESAATLVADHGAYVDGAVTRTEGYVISVVRQIAALDANALATRLTSLQSTVSSAAADLAVTDPLSGAPRPRTEDARDKLLPLVGTVTGTRVTTTSSGSLAILSNDARSVSSKYSSDTSYITNDAQIQQQIARATSVTTTVGTQTSGLLGNAVTLLQQALTQIDTASRLVQQATTQVAAITSRLDEAQTRSTAGNVLRAGELLDEAENLLSSGKSDDASSLYAASLEAWYRADIATQWDTLRNSLSAKISEARRKIVLARVELLAQQAEPLVNPSAGQEARPGEAIQLLEEADALWTTVYPLVQNTVVTPLLRKARLLQSQQQQVLTEDTPGFARLSQILNTARTAFDAGDYATASKALDYFLAEQPLNAEARLLDIRIELASGSGSPDAIVRNYVTRSLDEVTTTTGDSATVEQQINNAQSSSQLPDGVYNALLPLRSKLNAIEEISGVQSSIAASTNTRIKALLTSIDRILNPAPTVQKTAAQIRAESVALLQKLRAVGDWRNLAEEQKSDIYTQLASQQQLDPDYQSIKDSINIILSYMAPVRAPSPTEVAIMTNAKLLIQQKQDYEGALAVMERYVPPAGTSSPMLIPEWRELLNSLQDRLKRQ